jgi:hypothetical protein
MPPLMRVVTVAPASVFLTGCCFGAVYQPVLNHLTGRPLDYGIKDYGLAYFDAPDLSYEAEDAVIRCVKAAFDEPLQSMVEVRKPWSTVKDCRCGFSSTPPQSRTATEPGWSSTDSPGLPVARIDLG